MHKLILGWIDYLVFSVLLGASFVIGIYFGFFSKQDTTIEYLYGGKNMGYIPVAVSSLSSLLSGIILLGIPTEIYLYGIGYMVVLFGAIILALGTIYVFLPVFFKLQLPCTNHYLELRFSKGVRKFSSVAYLIGLIALTSIIIYVPALAFSQVTGFNVYVITIALSVICITYTSMGGIKAVIWTDTFQFFFTIIGLVAVFILGLGSVGGLSEVWRIANEGNRTTFFIMNPSMFERNTFWTILSGFIASLLSRFSVGQKFVQKFLSVSEEHEARKVVWLTLLGWAIVTSLCALVGLTIYAKYHGCDPLRAHYIHRVDQTLPYFVLDVAGHIPGLPGIFLAGLVSSSLAAMSACLNTLGGMIYDDFIDDYLPPSPNRESRAARIMKINVVVAGLISISLVMYLDRLGTLMEMLYAIGSVLDGPILGLFILGMLFPCAGSKGALVGSCTSFCFMLWLVGGSQWHLMNKRIRYKTLLLSTDQCPYPLNDTLSVITTTIAPLSHADEEPMALFRISIFHFSLIGTLITVVVGILVSYVTREMDASAVNPDYISPICQRFLPRKKYTGIPLNETSTTTTIEKDEII